MANEQTGGQTDQIQTSTVPKGDFDKLSADLAATKQTLEGLQQQLTDPDYVAYVANKSNVQRNQQPQQTGVNLNANVDLSKMTVGQFREFLVQQQQEFYKAAIAPQLQGLNQTLTNLAAKAELQDAEGSYEDFDEYRQDIYNILSTAGNELTIDQAYHIARSNRPPQEGNGGNGKVETPKPIQATNTPYRTQSSSEKPGTTIPVDGDGIKKFSTKEAAGVDAWNQVAAKHGISGDSI